METRNWIRCNRCRLWGWDDTKGTYDENHDYTCVSCLNNVKFPGEPQKYDWKRIDDIIKFQSKGK